MTSAEPVPGSDPTVAKIESIEIVGLQLLGVWALVWAVADSAYVFARLIFASYPDELAYVAWILAEACAGWTLATRAPRIAVWLRTRRRVDSPT